MGRIRALGYSLSWRMVLVALTNWLSVAADLPVLRLRSKRGKLLEETSTRMMWPLRNTLLVDHRDRKSTRLNSSHLGISYAVFCLKKKTTKQPASGAGHSCARAARRRRGTGLR